MNTPNRGASIAGFTRATGLHSHAVRQAILDGRLPRLRCGGRSVVRLGDALGDLARSRPWLHFLTDEGDDEPRN